MNFQFYLEKLEDSDMFKEFMKENNSAFLCSCFFSINKKENNNQIHFDFYVPNDNKMFSFNLEGNIEKTPIETITEIPEKIPKDIDFNIQEVEKLIMTEMENKKITNKVQKIFLSLQKKKEEVLLIGTVFISSLAILRVDIDIKEKRVVSFEKKSFFDMMRIVKNDDN